jgi:hypothetical protein
MSDWTIFDDTFWLTLSGLLFGVIGLGIRMCYRSKCKEVDFLCFHIVRDVDAEIQIDEQENNNADEV